MPRAFRSLDWYDTPLYYDIIFDQHTRAEVGFIETMYDRYVGRRGRRAILEPGCGSGRLLAPLARRGYDVHGFDLSAPMLDFARDRLARAGLSAGLRVAPMQSFSYRRRFDLAHCFVSTFKYLLTERDAESHLRCVARALRPGGIYLLGFHLTEYDDTEPDRERWTGRRGPVEVTCHIDSWPPHRRKRLERTRSRLTVTRRGRPVGAYQTEWDFRTYSDRQFRSLLRRVPELDLVAVHDFDYDPAVEHRLGHDRLDIIAVLRRGRS